MAIIKPNNNTISAITALPASITTGKILQVVQNTKTDTFSTSSTSDVVITGLTASITPSSTSSKILISGCVNFSETGGGGDIKFNVYRDSTQIFLGDADGSRNRVFTDIQTDISSSQYVVNPIFLDSPSSVSEITYSFKVSVHAGTVTGYVNRSVTDSNSSSYDRGASSITVMEIEG